MSKILKHKDKNEIIKRLTEGESIRGVEKWLKKKYPKDKTKWVSTPTLQSFRKTHLQLEGKVLKDIQDASADQRHEINQQQIQAQVSKTSAYRTKINKIVDTKLDVANKILQLDALIEDRIEYWYNAIGDGEATPQAADKELRQYMDRLMLLLQQYKKFVEGMADKTVEHNVNITVMNEQIGIIRDVVREVIEEFSPEHAILFIDKLNRRLEETDYLPAKTATVDTEQIGLIEAEIITEGDDEL